MSLSQKAAAVGAADTQTPSSNGQYPHNPALVVPVNPASLSSNNDINHVGTTLYGPSPHTSQSSAPGRYCLLSFSVLSTA